MNFPQDLQRDILLSKFTTFRIGGPAKYFFVATDTDELSGALSWAKKESLPYFVLGGGSNILFSDKGFDGLIIKYGPAGIEYFEEEGFLRAKADSGASFAKLILETTRKGYSGIEWGFGIPGTVGGAICGNAGRLGQDFSGVVEKVTVLGNKELSKKECEFDYRESRFKRTGEIILKAELIFQKKDPTRIEEVLNQAKKVTFDAPRFPSAGCVFKNYKLKENDELLKNHPELAGRVRGGKLGVGYLIDQCAMAGRKIGGAQIWPGHANYIVNAQDAKAADILELISEVKKEVKNKYGIELEEEIRII